MTHTSPPPNDDRHDCPKVGCPERLPFEVLACKPHWFLLPPRLRARLSRNWANGELDKYMAARDEAVAFLNG